MRAGRDLLESPRGVDRRGRRVGSGLVILGEVLHLLETGALGVPLEMPRSVRSVGGDTLAVASSFQGSVLDVASQVTGWLSARSVLPKVG